MSKRTIAFLVFFVMLFTMLPPVAFAEDSPIKITVDGKVVQTEVKPVNVDGRILIPARAVFEAMGAVVTWNASERSVSVVRGDTNVKIRIDGYYLKKNSDWTLMDVAPALIEGSTMIPVRAVSEALGAGVEWDAADQAVIIDSTPASSSPDAKYFVKADVGHVGQNSGSVYYSMGLTKDGSLYAWGEDRYDYQPPPSTTFIGMIYDRIYGTRATYDYPIKIADGVADFTTYNGRTLLLMKDGRLMLATSGRYAETYRRDKSALGYYVSSVCFQFQSSITDLEFYFMTDNVKEINRLGTDCFALLNDGRLLGFSFNNYAEIEGKSATELPLAPVFDATGENLVFYYNEIISDAVSVSYTNVANYALKKDGTLYVIDKKTYAPTKVMDGVLKTFDDIYVTCKDNKIRKIADISNSYSAELPWSGNVEDIKNIYCSGDYTLKAYILANDGTAWVDAGIYASKQQEPYVKLFDNITEQLDYPFADLYYLKNDGSLWTYYGNDTFLLREKAWFDYDGSDEELSKLSTSEFQSLFDSFWENIPAGEKYEVPYGKTKNQWYNRFYRYVKVADNVEHILFSQMGRLAYMTKSGEIVDKKNYTWQDAFPDQDTSKVIGAGTKVIKVSGGSAVANNLGEIWGEMKQNGYAYGDNADLMKNVTRGDMYEILAQFICKKLYNNKAQDQNGSVNPDTLGVFIAQKGWEIPGAGAERTARLMEKLLDIPAGNSGEVLSQLQIADLLTRFSSAVLAPLPPAMPVWVENLPRRVFSSDSIPINDRDSILDVMNYSVGESLGKSHMSENFLESDAPLTRAHMAVIMDAYARMGIVKDLTGKYPGGVTMSGIIDPSVEEILDKVITPGMSERDKVKAVYEFMVKNFSHTDTAAWVGQPPDIYDLNYDVTYPETILGLRLFITGSGTCDNFSNTFKLFMTRLAIPCNYVSGQFIGAGGSRKGHGWNQIRLDGEWFWVDVDAENSVYHDSGAKEPSYYLFMKKDAYWKTNHAWAEGIWPECK